jgi:serine/threonine protein kinase
MAFEWADGNLAEFWKKKPWRFQPSNFHDSLWFFTQCEGLAAGLRGIHNLRTSFRTGKDQIRQVLHDPHGRHSDIKPENILLYEDSDLKETGDGTGPAHDTRRLVIADLGCAQFHTPQTKSLVRISKVQGQTVSYSAPEVETVRLLGPRYDVWALGCVFLEHASVFIEENGEVVEKFSILRNKEDWDTHHSHEHRYTGNTFYIIRGFEDGEKADKFCKAETKATVTEVGSKPGPTRYLVTDAKAVDCKAHKAQELLAGHERVLGAHPRQHACCGNENSFRSKGCACSSRQDPIAVRETRRVIRVSEQQS